MNDTQRIASLAAAALFATSMAAGVHAQGYSSEATTGLTPIPRLDEHAFRLQATPNAIGLKPRYGIAGDSIDLPFGMNYNSDSKSLLMPIDPKSEWGIGLNLNLNSMRPLDIEPSSGLGLQPKRTPGLMLQKRF